VRRVGHARMDRVVTKGKKMRSKERELLGLYEEIFIHGTSYKQLLIDGFKIDEINFTLRRGGLKNLRLRHCIKLIRAARP